MPRQNDSNNSGTGRQTGRKAAKPRFPFQGYLNYNMPRDVAQDFDYQVSQGAISDEILADLLCDGYSVSQKWDAYNECFSASLYDNDPQRVSAGYALVVHSSTPKRALLKLLYGHCVVLQGDWSSVRRNKPEIW